jgi:hypothetical protein
MAADPGWALPHVMKAGFLLSLTEPGCSTKPHAHLAHARAAGDDATARERTHLEAVQALLEGRWHAACRGWDELLRGAPARRAGAAVGAAVGLLPRRRDAAAPAPGARAARVGRGRSAVPLRAGLYAFGLEECNLYPQAEDAGRRALAARPARPLGRARGGARDGDAGPLRRRRGLAAPAPAAVGRGQRLCRCTCGGTRRCSGWRRWTCRRAAAGRQAPVRRALQITLQPRRRRGHAVAAAPAGRGRQRPLAPRCWTAGRLDDAQPATTPSTTCTGAGACWRPGEMRAPRPGWRAAPSARCSPTTRGRSNHQMAREVGLPLMRGLLALARGDADGAADLIYPARALAAALRRQPRAARPHRPDAAGRRRRRRPPRLGRALLNERTMAKPPTPLTRHWAASASGRRCGREHA